MVLPLPDGQPVVLMPAAAGEQLRRWTWLPDASGAIVSKIVAEREELWLATLAGELRKLNIDTRTWVEGGHFQVSPDGSRVAFVANAGEAGSEIWAHEHVLPRARARK